MHSLDLQVLLWWVAGSRSDLKIGINGNANSRIISNPKQEWAYYFVPIRDQNPCKWDQSEEALWHRVLNLRYMIISPRISIDAWSKCSTDVPRNLPAFSDVLNLVRYLINGRRRRILKLCDNLPSWWTLIVCRHKTMAELRNLRCVGRCVMR
jgi:hypothetical protein